MTPSHLGVRHVTVVPTNYDPDAHADRDRRRKRSRRPNRTPSPNRTEDAA